MKGKDHDKYEQYTAPISSAYTEKESRDECIGINFTTVLKNIQSEFYKQTIGDILDIRLENINILKTYSDDGEYCGDIMSPYNGNIVSCIRKKRDFSAKILTNIGSLQVYNI